MYYCVVISGIPHFAGVSVPNLKFGCRVIYIHVPSILVYAHIQCTRQSQARSDNFGIYMIFGGCNLCMNATITYTLVNMIHWYTGIYRRVPSERPPYFHARMARKRGGGGADKR